MNANQRFLKEESLFISKINELYKIGDYDQIAKYRNTIFENIEIYKKTKVIFQITSHPSERKSNMITHHYFLFHLSPQVQSLQYAQDLAVFHLRVA